LGLCQKINPGYVQKASLKTSNWTSAVSQSVQANGEIFDSIRFRRLFTTHSPGSGVTLEPTQGQKPMIQPLLHGFTSENDVQQCVQFKHSSNCILRKFPASQTTQLKSSRLHEALTLVTVQFLSVSGPAPDKGKYTKALSIAVSSLRYLPLVSAANCLYIIGYSEVTARGNEDGKSSEQDTRVSIIA
jgi:hypothetical protein